VRLTAVAIISAASRRLEIPICVLVAVYCEIVGGFVARPKTCFKPFAVPSTSCGTSTTIVVSIT
jgi:hypothetical protein